MPYKGKLTFWDDAKGFGFITPADGGKGVFVHINEFHHSNGRPALNETITFKLSQDRMGRPCAVEAIRLSTNLSNRPLARPRNKVGLPSIVAALFIIAVAAFALTGYMPDIIFYYYAVVSLVTLLIYGYDKAAAVDGEWRTKENTLHFMSLIGGWPGALIAQDKLRHKSKKVDFRIGFWITVFINCGALIWLFTSHGSKFLQALIFQ